MANQKAALSDRFHRKNPLPSFPHQMKSWIVVHQFWLSSSPRLHAFPVFLSILYGMAMNWLAPMNIPQPYQTLDLDDKEALQPDRIFLVHTVLLFSVRSWNRFEEAFSEGGRNHMLSGHPMELLQLLSWMTLLLISFGCGGQNTWLSLLWTSITPTNGINS